MTEKIAFSKKQEEVISLLKHKKLKRINLLEGSVRSGKTWISLVLWAMWVATMPKDGVYLMAAKTLTALERNNLNLLMTLVGKDNFSFSVQSKKAVLFGRTVYLEGANDARSENKIRVTQGTVPCVQGFLFYILQYIKKLLPFGRSYIIFLVNLTNHQQIY